MRKIGDRFGYIPERVLQIEKAKPVEIFPVILEVVEYPLQDGSCTGCYFETETEMCEYRIGLLGYCNQRDREDKKNIIFKEV